MFTGIIEELGTVESVVTRAAGARLKVRGTIVMQDLTVGASIAVNGVCLTVIDPRPDSFCADLAPETLRRSNLGASAFPERPFGWPHRAGPRRRNRRVPCIGSARR